MEKAYDSGSGRSRGPEGKLIHEQMLRVLVDQYRIEEGSYHNLLKYARQYGSDMHGSDMHGSDMHGSYMHSSDMHRSDMHRSDMHRSDMHGSDMHGSGSLYCCLLIYKQRIQLRRITLFCCRHHKTVFFTIT